MGQQLSQRKTGGLRCALLCALCGFLSFVPYLFQDGGFFHVWSDFNLQQLPFGMALHNSLAGLNPGGWTWSYELGMSTIQAFSFYAMGSPFYWISLLFPVNWYPYLAGWLYILKYTVAGVTSYYFIRRFTKGENSAAAGALMYAFSAFQTTNLMYFHFHDVAALFPLLLIGTEKILEDPRDRGTLIFAVFINALNNYYFLVLEAVFTGMYFLFRAFGKEGKKLRRIARDALNALFCAVWGAAMAAVLLVPSLVYILQSPRADRAVSHSDLFWDLRWLGFTLRGLLLPGDTMVHQSAFYPEEYGSAAAWLPMAGMGLCLAYVLKNGVRRGTWLSRMIPALLLISVSPLLSSGFVLFREVTYRWWFMLALLAALASAKVMDAEGEYPVKKSLAVYFCAVLLFCAGVFAAHAALPEKELLNNPGRFAAFSGIALGGTALLTALHRAGKLNSRAAVALVLLFCAGTTSLTLGCYRGYLDFGQDKAYLERGMRLETHDPQYRYGTVENEIMLPAGGSGLTIFSSTISAGDREFDLLFDFGSKNHSLWKTNYRGLTELFAGKYRFCSDPEGQTPLQSMIENGEILHVLEQDACPIGFAVDRYILRDQLMSIREEDRGVALLYAAVIDPEEEAAVSGLCTNLSPEEIPFAEDLSAIVAKNTENRVLNFERDSHGFRCTSAYEAPRLVWFSVPDEGGWSAAVDGEKQEILPSAGMMLLKVPAGEHRIEFTYVTPGYPEGKAVSLAACAAFAAWLLFRSRGSILRRFRRKA